MAYNYYRGGSGIAERREETERPPVPKRAVPPLKTESGIAQTLSRLLPNRLGELETEDIILLLILYLMYRESGDSELLMIMGAMFLL